MADNRHLVCVNDSKLRGFKYQLWPEENYYCKDYQVIYTDIFFNESDG